MKRRRFEAPRRTSPKRPDENAALSRRLAAHVETYLGPVKALLEGSAAGGFRADLIWVERSHKRPFHTLITCGMAARPMSMAGARCRCSPLAELLLRLPADWPIGPHAPMTDQGRWPIEELFQLAYMPHLDQTHLGLGHTVTVVDSARTAGTPMSTGTGFHGWVLRNPEWTPPAFRQLRLGPRERLDFFSAVPLYSEELELAFNAGSGALFGLLDGAGVTDLVVADRPSVFGAIH